MNVAIAEAGTEASALLAALHARIFAEDGWTEPAFRALLGSGARALVAVRTDTPEGFVCFRAVADEAEILTLGVDPAARGRGTGRALLAAMEHASAKSGAARAFLEVSQANAAAAKLYEGAGWIEIARRARYYADGADARILEKRLAPQGAAGAD